MAYDNNDPDRTRFALFPNEYKKTDAHPEYKGRIEINRELLKTMNDRVKAKGFPLIMDVALWEEQLSKSGEHRYRSGSFQMGWEKPDDGKGDPLPDNRKKKEETPLTEPEDLF